jgi:hypothetical protein
LVTELDTSKIVPWLSLVISIEMRKKFSSLKIEQTHITWQLQSLNAMYSVSVKEYVTVFCVQDIYENTLPANLSRKPVWLCCVFESKLQFKSTNATKPRPDLPL